MRRTEGLRATPEHTQRVHSVTFILLLLASGAAAASSAAGASAASAGAGSAASAAGASTASAASAPSLAAGSSRGGVDDVPTSAVTATSAVRGATPTLVFGLGVGSDARADAHRRLQHRRGWRPWRHDDGRAVVDAGGGGGGGGGGGKEGDDEPRPHAGQLERHVGPQPPHAGASPGRAPAARFVRSPTASPTCLRVRRLLLGGGGEDEREQRRPCLPPTLSVVAVGNADEGEDVAERAHATDLRGRERHGAGLRGGSGGARRGGARGRGCRVGVGSAPGSTNA